MRHFFAAGLVLTGFVTAAGAQQQSGPIVMRGGNHYAVPNPTHTVPKDQTYKIAWDVKLASPKPDSINLGIMARKLPISSRVWRYR